MYMCIMIHIALHAISIECHKKKGTYTRAVCIKVIGLDKHIYMQEQCKLHVMTECKILFSSM